MALLPMSRYRAFAIHLAISGTIFVVLLALILLRWYPVPYFAYDGGWRGIRIVAGVDLVLGPLLTLIVFRAGKRGLKLDLTLIGLLQAAALAYGVTQVYRERTALVVFFNHAFYTVAGSQIPTAGPRAAFWARQGKPPVYVTVPIPTDKKANYAMWTSVFHGQPPPYLQGQRYVAFQPQQALSSGLNLAPLLAKRPQARRRMAAFLHGRPATRFAFVPLDCRFKRLFLAIDRKTGRIAGAVDINPYPLFNVY